MTTTPATRRSARFRGVVFDALRKRLIRQFVGSEAMEIEAAWAVCGWTQQLVRRATSLVTSLIAVFGPGDYRIIHIPRPSSRPRYRWT